MSPLPPVALADLLKEMQGVGESFKRNHGLVVSPFAVQKWADTLAAALSAPVSPQETETGWQPIATAPREASCPRVLVSGADGVSVAYWDAYYAPGGSGYDGRKSAWVEPMSSEMVTSPTHWKSLPAPPASPATPQTKEK